MGEIFQGSGAGRKIGIGGVGKVGPTRARSKGFVVFFTGPRSTASFSVSGVTKDSTGAALGGCTVELFKTADNSLVSAGVSDGSGNYSLRAENNAGTFYVVAYKAGSPDVSGTTANTLAAS